MNAMGVSSAYGVKEKAEERVFYLQKTYAIEHWIETWNVTEKDNKCGI
jgi:hypothetical protein